MSVIPAMQEAYICRRAVPQAKETMRLYLKNN
jgi:hypothetical protein